MQNNWLFPLDLDPNGGSLNMFPVEPPVSGHLLSHIISFVDNSLYNFRYMHVPGSLALQQAFSRLSKLAGTFLFCFASGSNINHRLPNNSHGSNTRNCRSSTQINRVTSVRHNLVGFDCNSSRQKGESNMPVIFGKLSRFTIRQLCEEVGEFKFPLLSLAAALVPPFDNVSRNVLAIPLADGDVVMQRCMGSEVEQQQGCGDFSFHNFNYARSAVEPRTGIEFPAILENMLAGGTNSSLMSEVLVGTGSRTMKIIKIKSLKVYAFGFYVHPNDVCEKLGPKYASIPASELNKHHNFYKDLLREDINMTVRLVVSCNGMKISTVRDAFEKSLRARLIKTNPDTDYDCLKTFGSLFSKDIPIRAGTTIYFRRTADGHLVTEIGGSQIGAVHSKDLCRAFFDMYIGDVPVCEQTKEEIGRNVANIIRRC